MIGVILYGPPASGKDTISTELNRIDPRFRTFRRLKVGAGKTATYRMVSMSELDGLRRAKQIIWENERYGATYAVDLPGLRRALGHSVPVIHLGQIPAIDAVRAAIPEASWFVVSLSCPREATRERLQERNPQDVEERLRVWEETLPLADADLYLDTGSITATDSARAVHRRVQSLRFRQAPSVE